MDEVLLGPLGALGFVLVVCGLLYTGKIHPRNMVPREDLDKVLEINGAYAGALKDLTKSVDALVLIVQYQQRNGGS